MDAALAQLVRQRAGDRCEYCRLPQSRSSLRFHVEHVVARQHGGKDAPENLALACPECNRRKGTNLTGLDPDTGRVVRLFHPRQDRWEDHFRSDGPRLLARTDAGRMTLWLLAMNTGPPAALARPALPLGRMAMSRHVARRFSIKTAQEDGLGISSPRGRLVSA